MTKHSPDFVQPEVPTASQRADRWLMVVMPVLLLTLLLQTVLADRSRLANERQWRPHLQTLCNWLRCSLPPWHDPQAFHITSREIRRHPSMANTLLVTASFRNDAPFEQAWPLVQLSLGNLNGDTLGLRRFEPHEYLGEAPASARIATGQSVSLTLEITDPGKQAVAFGFEFR